MEGEPARRPATSSDREHPELLTDKLVQRATDGTLPENCLLGFTHVCYILTAVRVI